LLEGCSNSFGGSSSSDISIITQKRGNKQQSDYRASNLKLASKQEGKKASKKVKKNTKEAIFLVSYANFN